ncbi:hypothetical protein, partial [Devosia ginsengisoli]|uniref:hypothetical protein n=1 Tax=Devosia ginsengisoli TaxID=400770 RepID=UPI0026EDE5F3
MSIWLISASATFPIIALCRCAMARPMASIAELIAHGAVGDLAGHFLNARGVPLFGTAMKSVCNAPHFRRSITFSDLLKADTTTTKLFSSFAASRHRRWVGSCCNAVNCLDSCRPHFGHEAA